jgi:hypothetical protein
LSRRAGMTQSPEVREVETHLPEAPASVGTPVRATWAGAAFASALAVAFAVLMVVGVVRAWDPLLHMDEWDGYAGFWYRLEDGETSAWWAQHNEHRIVLARLLFWFDARFLHGASWFMAACIVVAVCGSAALLVWALRARLREVAGCRYPAYGTWMIAAAIVAVATSWMQRQNLLWGFQIQFILGSLLPLVAFVLIGAAGTHRGRAPVTTRWLLGGAAVASILSVGTIASGLATPTLATLLVAVVGFSRKYVAVFALLALGLTGLYLHGYKSPDQHARPLDLLLQRPWTVIEFVSHYLGAPAYLATGSMVLSVASSVLFVVICLAYATRQASTQDRHGIGLAMLTFAGYVLVGAVATAAGRVNLGAGQAFASRYETPVLLAWACLLVIAAPRAMTLLEGNSWPCVAALVAVPLLLLPRQLQALADPSADLAGRRLATVAVALGVPDPEALSLVSPDPRLPIQLGRRLMADRLTVVGEEPWRSLGERLGTHEPRLPAAGCDGALVEVRSVPDSPFFSIRGWTQAPGDVPVTAAPLPLVNPAGTTVGFAVSQTGALGQKAVLADSTPFAGYVRSASSLRGLNLQLPQGTCSTLWP